MLTLLKTTTELKTRRLQERGRVGFVPTMGNLHSGHISLMEKALEDNDVIYFSIFVNPKQFGPNEDYTSYPRTLEIDLNLIKESLRNFPKKEVIVFAPENPQEVFPEKDQQIISVQKLNKILEGEFRPTHFDGVATVVFRLFDLVRPKRAYFGLKDYQQFLVIRQMVKDLALPVTVIGMPIIRENSGLALSSRNQYLNSEQKEKAQILNKSLRDVEQIIQNKKENLSRALQHIEVIKQDERWNYLEIRDSENLSSDLTHSSNIIILGVYQLGLTRLLDNLQMELQ